MTPIRWADDLLIILAVVVFVGIAFIVERGLPKFMDMISHAKMEQDLRQVECIGVVSKVVSDVPTITRI